MSYILDALKKADRDRHLARVPTLHTVPLATPRAPRRLWPWIVAGALVLNAGVIGWFWSTTARPAVEGQERIAMAPAVPSPARTPDAAFPVAPSAPPATSPPPSVPPVAPAPAAAPAASLPASTAVSTPAVSAPAARSADAPERRPLVGAAPPSATAVDRQRPARGATMPRSGAEATGPSHERGATPDSGSRLPEGPTLAVASPPAIAPPATRVPSPAPPTAAPPRSGSAPTPSGARPPEPAIVAVPPPPAAEAMSPPQKPVTAESAASKTIPTPRPPLAAATDPQAAFQEAMSKLKLSALVYADVPSERMIFVNGRKYVEGDSIEGLLRIEQITQDGAVLSYQGRRSLLKP